MAMCIFCGGQCGGVGDLLISLGLPFLAIYLLRLQVFLARMKRKILRQPSSGGEIPGSAKTCECCGELSPHGPHRLMPIIPEVRLDQPFELSTTAIPKNLAATKKEPEGVRGWLLLLCFNLVILIPAFSIYQADCIVNILFLPQYRILLSLWSRNYYHLNIAMIFIALFIAAYSFYSGWQLWSLKEGAVKTVKTFLIVQLSVTVLTLSLQKIVIPQSALAVSVSIHILGQCFTAILYFSVWYLYLMKSRRVQNTYGQAARRAKAQYAPA
jgi:Protein of unknown function (DUF2569)